MVSIGRRLLLLQAKNSVSYGGTRGGREPVVQPATWAQLILWPVLLWQKGKYRKGETAGH
jgi:hypothetical protein